LIKDNPPAHRRRLCEPERPQALIIHANGGQFVAYRKTKQRLPVKGVYAEMPNTAMGQDGAAARDTG
jgi:hypothetical protein